MTLHPLPARRALTRTLLAVARRAMALRQAPPKTCGCGAVHVVWTALPFVGLGGDEVERFDMRNCPCNSTLCRSLAP